MVKHFYAQVRRTARTDKQALICTRHLAEFLDDEVVHVYIVRVDPQDQDASIIEAQQAHIEKLANALRELKEQTA